MPKTLAKKCLVCLWPGSDYKARLEGTHTPEQRRLVQNYLEARLL